MSSEKLRFFSGIIISVCLIAGAAQYSIQAGVFTAGFIGVCMFILFSEKRRQLWEYSISFDLKNLKKTQENISSSVARTEEEIGALKDNIARGSLAPRPKEKIEIKTKIEIEQEKIIRPRPVPKPPEIREAPGAPRALRAGEASFRNVPAPRRYDEITAKALSDETVKKLTQQAVKSENVEMFLQPVVRLPQRKARYYEMFARIRARPGLYLPASRYMNLAQENEISVIDRLLLAGCLDLLNETAGLDRAAPFFMNITQRTLKSALYMKKLLSFLAARRELAERLIFEMPQEEFETLQPAVAEIITGLGKVGCGFSIDNVSDLDFNIPALQRQNIRYIKISAKALLKQTRDERAFAESLRMKRRLEGNGIVVIAEKIESEKELKELLDFDIHYGQGHLFGKPDVRVAYQQRNSHVTSAKAGPSTLNFPL